VAAEIPKIDCPYDFVNPLAADHLESCIHPCPVQAHDESEHTTMWALSNGIEVVGFALNLFLACTWFIAGKRHLSDQPFQLKWCMFAGLVCALVGTFPSLILKHDLPCECETEECMGTSTMCAVNRFSIYVLLSILINLCALTCQLASAVKGASGHDNKTALNLTTTVVPMLLAALGFALEGDQLELCADILVLPWPCLLVVACGLLASFIFNVTNSPFFLPPLHTIFEDDVNSDANENEKLNKARYAFSCSMRYPVC
jgi:hypothetical protein